MIKQLDSEMQKLTSEELVEFKETHNTLSQAIADLGLLEVEYSDVKNHLDVLANNKTNLLLKIKEISNKKQEISINLGNKYGDKQVDLETGELK